MKVIGGNYGGDDGVRVFLDSRVRANPYHNVYIFLYMAWLCEAEDETFINLL